MLLAKTHLNLLSGSFPAYQFSVERYELSQSNQTIKELGEMLLVAFRSKKMLREQYANQPPESLKIYLEEYAFPADRNGIVHNKPKKAVCSGDFGEALIAKIVTDIHGLKIPFPKMFWKLRNDKSSFCTDIFAHNENGPITDLHYYEVKVRQGLPKTESKKEPEASILQ